VPDPDPMSQEVIEFSPASPEPPVKPAHPVRSRLLIAGAAAAVVAIAAVVVFAGIKPGGTSHSECQGTDWSRTRHGPHDPLFAAALGQPRSLRLVRHIDAAYEPFS
jgi:hypothetical protein